MSSIRCDAEWIEANLSTIMRGLNRQVSQDPLAELPLAQLRLLRAVGRGIRTPSALAEYLSTSVSAVTQIANRLEAAKLIEREEDPTDRRVRRLQLSRKGARIIKHRAALRVDGAEKMLSALTEEERCIVMRGFALLESTCAEFRPQDDPDSLALLAELERTYPKRTEHK